MSVRFPLVLRLARADWIALGAITVFFFVFFAWAIFGNGYLFGGDSLFYSLPLRTVAWRTIKSGHLPLWTPEILSGYPLLSMAQLGLGYPLTWTYLFLPPYLAEKVYVLTPFLLMPCFTYAYLRHLKKSPLASLFGSLTFGYGGMMASPLASNGLVAHSVMWLPLLLICVDSSKRWRFIPTLSAATFLYSMSVLNGLAQGFLIVGILVGLYSIWVTIFGASDPPHGKSPSLRWHRYKPLLVGACAASLTMGVAAFQILETSRVVRRSVRHALSYESFTQGAFFPRDVWHSITTPIFYVVDMNAYVPPLAVLLILLALYAHLRRLNGERDSRVFFWSIVAAVSCVLMMGPYTPIYKVIYHIPILNLFRVPSRHTIEWTFAAGVLAAYGWDAAMPFVKRLRTSRDRSQLLTVYLSLGCLILGTVVGVLWWTRATTLEFGLTEAAHSITIYKTWKACFMLLLFCGLWRGVLIADTRWRNALLGIAILILCFVEPSLLLKRWWTHLGRPASQVGFESATTRFLLDFPPNENRVYTRVNLMSEQEGAVLRFDAPNLSAIWGLQNVGGYEPLILERYSRALGGVWLDGVHTMDLGPADPSLLTSRSHVLDLLNTKFVVSYRGLATSLAGENVPSTPSSAWQKVYDANGTVIMRNNNALPRAWLVSEAQAKLGEEVIAKIREDETFDPRKTALLEINPDEMPPLTGIPLEAGSGVRITAYDPNRIVLESKASVPTILIVSEIFFPGWEATIDGQPTRILLTDYVLRSVALPAGEHKIEMRYTAPAFRNGSILSLTTIVLLGTLFVYDRRKIRRLSK